MLRLDLSYKEVEFILKMLDKELRTSGISNLPDVVGLYNVIVDAKNKDDEEKQNASQHIPVSIGE